MKFNNDYIDMKFHSFTFPDLISFQYSKVKSKKISLDKCLESIGECHISHEVMITNLDTRDGRLYRKVRKKYHPYYQKLRDIHKLIGEDKKHLSQAFFKMYEIMELFDLVDKKLDKINTFHGCELPGSFIFAINHYLKTKTNIKNYNWTAQSLNEMDNPARLEDSYKLLNIHKKRYNFGPKNNGNFMHLDNIDYYLSKYSNSQLITFDCGMPMQVDGVSSNKLMTKLEHSVVYFLLSCGKNSIMKLIIPMDDSILIKLIGILCRYYEEVHFYKSEQAYTSNEFYLVMKNFKKDSNLNKILQTIRKYLEGNGKLNIDEYLEEDFYGKYCYMYSKIVHHKTEAVRQKIYTMDRINILEEDSEFNSEIEELVSKKKYHWINKYNIERISSNDKLL
jgi:hypothetical protein